MGNLFQKYKVLKSGKLYKTVHKRMVDKFRVLLKTMGIYQQQVSMILYYPGIDFRFGSQITFLIRSGI